MAYPSIFSWNPWPITQKYHIPREKIEVEWLEEVMYTMPNNLGMRTKLEEMLNSF